MDKLLDKINSPDDLKDLSVSELDTLCAEIRKYFVDVITNVGGHFGSSLGVVELTVALHYVFDTPKDKLIWDVGHQGYVHKILTGRKNELNTIRQYKGLSGFLKRSESEYDNFGAGQISCFYSKFIFSYSAPVSRVIKRFHLKIILPCCHILSQHYMK